MLYKDLVKLKPQFDKLKTVKQKFAFWNGTLKKTYAVYANARNIFIDDFVLPEIMSEYDDFRIVPKKSEYVEYNKTLLNEYTLYLHSPNRKKNFKCWDVTILINEVEQSLASTKNQKSFLEIKINEVNELFEYYDKLKKKDNNDERASFFKYSFEQLFFNEVEFDLSMSYYELPILIAINDGKVKAQYLRFLKERLTSILEEKSVKTTTQLNTSKNETKVFTTRQKLQVLYYLGVFENVHKANKLANAKFFTPLLNHNTFDRIKEELTKYPEIIYSKNKKERNLLLRDLGIVKAHFIESKLLEIVTNIDADIQKLAKG